MWHNKTVKVGWQNAEVTIQTSCAGDGDSSEHTVIFDKGDGQGPGPDTTLISVRGDWEAGDLVEMFEAAAKYLRAALELGGVEARK